MATSVSDVMTSNPKTVDASSSVVEAAKLMLDEDTGIIPIVDGDRLAGTITDRDLAIRVVAEGQGPADDDRRRGRLSGPRHG